MSRRTFEHSNLRTDAVVNALSIDVEDYFQVEGFADVVSREEWDGFAGRVERNTEKVLEILDRAQTRATFFVLGWVAERHPGLVRAIGAAGHELASHGFDHQMVTRMTPARFREDLRRSVGAIEEAAAAPVRGYRAPTASIGRDNLWALDILIEEGFAYDSSIFPGHHDRYGIPDWEPYPHRLGRRGGHLAEFPLSTMPVGGLRLPLGGGFFRLYPMPMIRRRLRTLNAEGRPAMLFLHPWELDPEQPRIRGRWGNRLRHYWNLGGTARRLESVIREFPFVPAPDVLANLGLLSADPSNVRTFEPSNALGRAAR